jgi:hypothetical protein
MESVSFPEAFSRCSSYSLMMVIRRAQFALSNHGQALAANRRSG